MRLRTAAVALALVAGACKTTSSTSTQITGTPRLEPAPAAAAPAPAPAPAATSPAGKWTVGLTAQGQMMEVTLELVKLGDGTWAGSIGTSQFGTIPLSKVTVEGTKMTATFPVPTGDMGSMTLTFTGDNAEGEWSMPGDGSKVSGKRNR
ncbi:MAG: hypothetical protein K1X31_02710 [Gemmatimonadaceae bacterium]|nr:hypothetical protein [Gemmatimonadaceae bacterium]